MTLVSYSKKISDYTKHSLAAKNAQDLTADLEAHGKQERINTDGFVATPIYKLKTGISILSCNPSASHNETVGFAYINKDNLANRLNNNPSQTFDPQEAVSLMADMDSALQNLSRWHIGHIYQVTLLEGGVEQLKSKICYSITEIGDLLGELIQSFDVEIEQGVTESKARMEAADQRAEALFSAEKKQEAAEKAALKTEPKNPDK